MLLCTTFGVKADAKIGCFYILTNFFQTFFVLALLNKALYPPHCSLIELVLLLFQCAVVADYLLFSQCDVVYVVSVSCMVCPVFIQYCHSAVGQSVHS